MKYLKNFFSSIAFALAIASSFAFNYTATEQVRSIKRVSIQICQNVSPFNAPQGCHSNNFGVQCTTFYTGDTAYIFANYDCVSPLYRY